MAAQKTPNFIKAFTDQFILQGGIGRKAILRVYSIGRISLPSGRLVICDPMQSEASPNWRPLIENVPPGTYRVDLALRCQENHALLGGGFDSGRVACARVQVSETIPVVWRPAELESKSKKGKYEFSVESGTACFVDASRASNYFQREHYVEELSHREGGDPWGEGSSFTLKGKEGNTELIGFSTGFGDGAYRGWWGRDAQGQLAWFVVDFGLLFFDEWIEDAISIENPGPVSLPEIGEKLDIVLQVLSAWEGKPIDSATTVSLKYSLPAKTFVAGSVIEFGIMDSAGNVIEVEKRAHGFTENSGNSSKFTDILRSVTEEDLFDDSASRMGELVRLQAKTPFSAGWKLRVSAKVGQHPLR